MCGGFSRSGKTLARESVKVDVVTGVVLRIFISQPLTVSLQVVKSKGLSSSSTTSVDSLSWRRVTVI